MPATAALLLLILLLVAYAATQDAGPSDVWQQLMRQCAGNKVCQPLVINTLLGHVAGQHQQLAQQEQAIEEVQQRVQEQEQQALLLQQQVHEQRQQLMQAQLRQRTLIRCRGACRFWRVRCSS